MVGVVSVVFGLALFPLCPKKFNDYCYVCDNNCDNTITTVVVLASYVISVNAG